MKSNWRLIAFIGTFLVIGVPYWLMPYHEVNLPSALMGPGLLVVGVASLVLRAWGAAGFWQAAIVAGAAVPAVVLTRVVVDTQGDPTSHTLWPFEVIIALGVGLFPAVSGAFVGSLLAKLTSADSTRERPSMRRIEEAAVTRRPGLKIMVVSAAFGLGGVLPLLLYVAFGPADGNPIGLGLLAVATVPVGVIGLAAGFVTLVVQYFRTQGP